MSKLYTKTGDKGFTTLYDMKKVKKTSIYIETLGYLDDLSTHIGYLRVIMSEKSSSLYKKNPESYNSIIKILYFIQDKLLDIGSDIATTSKRTNIKTIQEKDTKMLENAIDYYTSEVPELKEFIISGVYKEDAYAGICRTSCRKAEIKMIQLKEFCIENSIKIHTNDETYKFLNRMSDFFFALARYFCQGEEIKRSEIENFYKIEF
jgi:cob(I)alamin adenosyltransferase